MQLCISNILTLMSLALLLSESEQHGPGHRFGGRFGGGGFGRWGMGQFYNGWPYGPGICETIPDMTHYVGLGAGHFPGACGRCVGVNYNGMYERAYVHDTCPECLDDQLLLGESLYNSYGGSAMDMDLNWDFVDC